LTGQLKAVVTVILTEERILAELTKIEFQLICDALDLYSQQTGSRSFFFAVNRPDLALYFCISPASETVPTRDRSDGSDDLSSDVSAATEFQSLFGMF